MNHAQRDEMREELHAWWPLVARAVSFFSGLGIMINEALGAADRPWLLAAALGMMNLPIAGVIAYAMGYGNRPEETNHEAA